METEGSSRSIANVSCISHDEFSQIIRKAYLKLTTSLTKTEVKDIAARLYSCCIITHADYEHIQASSTDTDSARALCMIILKTGELASERFLKALHEISRDDLVDMIWKDASTPDKQKFLARRQMATEGSSTADGSRRGHDEFSQIIRNAYLKLTTSLTNTEVKDIAARLYSCDIIMNAEYELLQESSTAIESAQALCNIILKKDEFACEIFLKTLREISRDDLADLIWKEASTLDKQRLFEKLGTPNTLHEFTGEEGQRKKRIRIDTTDIEQKDLLQLQTSLDEKKKDVKQLQAQLEEKIKDNEDLANRQREKYDRQMRELNNQEEKLQRQQMMLDEKEKSLKVLQEKLEKQKTEPEIRERQQQANTMSISEKQKDLLQRRQSLDEKEKSEKQLQAQLEESIKDNEDLANRQREKYHRQMQELKNQEEKLQRQLMMLNEKEKSLKVLQEKLEKQKTELDKLKTELEIRERQQQANTMSIDEKQKDLLQRRQSLDAKEKSEKQLQGSYKFSLTPIPLVCVTDSSPSGELSRTKEVSPVTSSQPPSEAGHTCTEGAERIPAVEVSNLLRALSTGLKKIEDEVGSFSYAFGKNMKLTARIHNPETTSETALETKLKEFLRMHISERFVKVKIKQAPVTVNFCCGGIGSDVRVADACQTLGLYLQYDEEGTVYWVSCAHGLMGARTNHGDQPHQCTQRQVLDKQFSETMHRENTPLVRAALCTGRRLEVSMINLPSPYVYLNYNPCQRVNGTRLLHSVDIMVGVTPLTPWHLTNPGSLSSRFVSPEDAQCRDQECLNTGHSENCTLGRIVEIIHFELEPICDTDQTFSAQELADTHAHVFCRVSGNSRLLSGKVKSVTNQNVMCITNVNPRCMVQNVIMIKPNPNSSPELGHSGSVWVMKKRTGRGYSAIAMTCAILIEENTGKKYWLASLLCASLLALSEEYPRTFPDYRRFRVLDLRQQAGADF